MKIKITASSSWGDEKVVEYDSIDACLEDLRNGAHNDLMDENSFCFKDGKWENPTEFIVSFDEYVSIEIYDYYVE